MRRKELQTAVEQAGGLAQWPTETVYVEIEDGQEKRRSLESQVAMNGVVFMGNEEVGEKNEQVNSGVR